MRPLLLSVILAGVGSFASSPALAETPFYCSKTLNIRSEPYPLVYRTEIFDLDKVDAPNRDVAEAIVEKRWEHWAPEDERAYGRRSYCAAPSRGSHDFGLIPNNLGYISDIRKFTDLPKNWPYLDPAEIKAAQGKKPEQEKTKSHPKQEAAAEQASPTAAELAAEKHRAVEERNRLAQEKYEAELAEQKRKVEEYERAKEEVARKKAEQQAAAEQVLAQYESQKAAHEATLRQHEAEMAAYKAEVDAAAKKVVADLDKRNGLKASTDTDANMCVTSPETRLNASFKGNTAASVINGCGQPVDVRICLMTDKGWNCGVTYGLASQQGWSHSSFNATGRVFSDARTSGSSRPLATPN